MGSVFSRLFRRGSKSKTVSQGRSVSRPVPECVVLPPLDPNRKIAQDLSKFCGRWDYLGNGVPRRVKDERISMIDSTWATRGSHPYHSVRHHFRGDDEHTY